jgi:antitoxin MazE
MNAHFSKWGNSLALRIPNSLAKELHVFEGKAADLQVQGGALVVTPVEAVPVYDLDELVSQITDENRYGEEISGHYAVGNET